MCVLYTLYTLLPEHVYFILNRIRPQLAREQIDMCRTCTTVAAETKQVSLGSDRMFTYDFVFDMDSQQERIYDTIVRSLIEGYVRRSCEGLKSGFLMVLHKCLV